MYLLPMATDLDNPEQMCTFDLVAQIIVNQEELVNQAH